MTDSIEIKNNIDISIIVPVHNSEKYISKCLGSIMAQTYNQIEIICIDDGSDDNSLGILQEFANKDRRVKVHTQAHKGTGSARNNGLNNACGSFIGFVDSDDWIEPETYEKAISKMVGDIDIVTWGANISDLNSNLSQQVIEYTELLYNSNLEGKHKVTDDLIFKSCPSVSNKLFRKSHIDKYNIYFPEGLFFEDMEFFYKYILHSNNIYYINEKLYNYIQRSGSTMHQFQSKEHKEYYSLMIFDNIYNYYKQNSGLEKYKILLRNKLVKSFKDDEYFCVSTQDDLVNIKEFTKKLIKNYDSDIINLELFVELLNKC